jgi:arylsulfatase A-like enzyme
MMADNVGYNDIRAYGEAEVRCIPTPRIDQIASKRLRLTQNQTIAASLIEHFSR